MITTLNTRKMVTFAGFFALAALALVFPIDAFAQIAGLSGAEGNITAQSQQLARQVGSIPQLVAIGCYVIGTFFIVRCMFALKGFIESPDDNPISGVLAFGAIGAALIIIPYVIRVLTGSVTNGGLQGAANSMATNFTSGSNLAQGITP